MKKTEFSLSQTVMRLAELGLDESEIVYSLGITKRKFAALKEQKEIANALASGEESLARKVEDALYRRAVGFEYEEVVNAVSKPPTISPRSDKSELPPFNKGGRGRTSGAAEGGSCKGEKSRTGGKNSLIKAVKNTLTAAEKTSAKSTIKTVIPDVTACIFWLKNRQADKWRDSNDKTNGKKPLIEAMEDYDEESENK